ARRICDDFVCGRSDPVGCAGPEASDVSRDRLPGSSIEDHLSEFADAGDLAAGRIHVQENRPYLRIVQRQVEVLRESVNRGPAADGREQVRVAEDRTDDWKDRHAAGADGQAVRPVNAPGLLRLNRFKVWYMLTSGDLENHLQALGSDRPGRRRR